MSFSLTRLSTSSWGIPRRSPRPDEIYDLSRGFRVYFGVSTQLGLPRRCQNHLSWVLLTCRSSISTLRSLHMSEALTLSRRPSHPREETVTFWFQSLVIFCVGNQMKSYIDLQCSCIIIWLWTQCGSRAREKRDWGVQKQHCYEFDPFVFQCPTVEGKKRPALVNFENRFLIPILKHTCAFSFDLPNVITC